MAMATITTSTSASSKSPRLIATTLKASAQAGLQKRGLTNCDGQGTFTCDIGTCYTGVDGFIGCCSVSSCAARTTCIPYDSLASPPSCDPNTGGCLACGPNTPGCQKITNVVENQYIIYCGADNAVYTYSYHNLVTTGSTAGIPIVSASTTSSSTSSQVSSSPSSTSTATSSSPISTTSSSSPTPSPIPSPVPSHGLPAGTIAAIVIGSVLGLVLLLFSLYFCLLRPYRSRKKNALPHGTLGGAALPPPSPRTTTKSRSSLWRTSKSKPPWHSNIAYGPRPTDHGQGPDTPGEMSALRNNEVEVMSRRSTSGPWSPTSVMSSAELDSVALMQGERREPEENCPDERERGLSTSPSTPTARYVLEAEDTSSPSQLPSEHPPQPICLAPLIPGSPHQPRNPHESTQSTQSNPVSESSWFDRESGGQRLTPLSPMSAGSGGGWERGVNASANGSGNGNGFDGAGMSARGSWRGYLTPEMAMAGGWKGDEEGAEEGNEGEAQLEEEKTRQELGGSGIEQETGKAKEREA